MWRLFRWLDRHPPDFYKFTVIVAGIAGIIMMGFVLGRIHTAAGIVFVFAALFSLMYSSFQYRLVIRPLLEEKEGKAPAPPPPPGPKPERPTTAKLRRMVLANLDAPGKRGELARSIKKRWDEAEAAKANEVASEDKNDNPRS